MIPLASPDEVVLFEDFDDASGDSVLVTIGFFASPAPVVGVFDVDIQGDPEAVGTQAFCPLNKAPIEGSSDVGDVFFVAARKFFEFLGDASHFFVDVVDGVDTEPSSFFEGVGHPVDGYEVLADFFLGGAVHFSEKIGDAKTTWIEKLGRRCEGVESCGITETHLIFKIGEF